MAEKLSIGERTSKSLIENKVFNFNGHFCQPPSCWWSVRGGRGRIGEVAPGKLSVGEQPAPERHLHILLLAHIYLACDDVGRFFCVLSFGLYLCRSASSSVSSRLLYLGSDDPDLLS